MRLGIDMLGAEEPLRALDGQRLNHVHVFASAIPAAAGIALRILVGETGSLRFHDRPAGKVLAGDQLDILELAAPFLPDRIGDLRIDRGEAVR